MKEKIEKYEEVTQILKVLAHPVRLTLVETMLTKGPTNVRTMYEKLQMSQSTISQHLAQLKAAKIITSTRKGSGNYYKVVDNRIKVILSILFKS